MNGKLEEIIVRVLVEYFADRVLERLGLGGPARHASHRAARPPAPVPVGTRGGVFSREDAALCAPEREIRLSRRVLITPLAADELVRRCIRVVRE